MFLCVASCLLGAVTAQQVGKMYENHPPVAIAYCSMAKGCVMEQSSLTLDANMRWLHKANDATTCYDPMQEQWNATLCNEATACAEQCAIDGVNLDAYTNTYGVALAPRGVKLNYVKTSQPRVYMLEKEDKYRLFKLKNREFAFDVDVSNLPSGLNGAVYFVEMDAHGGRSGANKAGAAYGLGYCDAQCPRNIKFINGAANLKEWDPKSATGLFGHCCAEVDIWEANRAATALTLHPCNLNGPQSCQGDQCSVRQGVCDKQGCLFNADLMGNPGFFGPGPKYTVDTTKPLTVVTQWFTTDGTDKGDLSDVRRIYMQDGKVIYNSNATTFGVEARDNKLTDKLCQASKNGSFDSFTKNGGMKSLGHSMDRGMVLAMSLWFDQSSGSGWLVPSNAPKPDPSAFPGSYVVMSNFMYGEIGAAMKYRLAATGPELSGKSANEGPLRELSANGLHYNPAAIMYVAAACVALGVIFVAKRKSRLHRLADYGMLLSKDRVDAIR